MTDQIWTPASMGRKGGRARAANMTQEQRTAHALKAAGARWAKHAKPVTAPVAATVQMQSDGRWLARMADGTGLDVGSSRDEAVKKLASSRAKYWARQIEARIVSLACDLPKSE